MSFPEMVEIIKVEFLQTYVNSFYLLTFFFKISVLVIFALLLLTCTKNLNEGSFENNHLRNIKPIEQDFIIFEIFYKLWKSNMPTSFSSIFIGTLK